MKNLFLFLALCPLLLFSNTEKLPSTIKKVTVYLSGAQITRLANCNLPSGASDIVLTGLSTKIDESSIQISGLQAVSILSMSYDINYMVTVENTTVSQPLLDRIKTINTKIAFLRSSISGLEEEQQVIYANRTVGARTQALSLEKLKEISTYYRKRITSIKSEIFMDNLEINVFKEETRTLQKQLAEHNNVPEKEHGEIKIKFDAPVASTLKLSITYQVQDAGWIPNYDIKSTAINTPLNLTYKAHVYQKTGKDWNNAKITLSTGNPNVNVAKPELGTKYLNFTSGYKSKTTNIKKRRYVYNPTVKQISGTIVDASGIPLAGASIMVKGTSNGTQTDFDGHFSINAQNGQELTISYLGFNNTELPIYSSVMNVQLEEDMQALDEVVVVGYGISSKKSITGAVSMINAEQVLAGRTPGIKIRGSNSVKSYAQPIYILDGIILSSKEVKQIDPEMMATVEVLKGENATSIYGSRGNNGVVIMTSKKSFVEEELITVKFVIKKAYSIATDGDITSIEINTFKLDASYEYLAAPIINENVFLTSTFKDWEQYNLLPGEASVYFDGSYAGKTTIDPYTTKKEMTVSLGIDPNITVTRKQNKNFKSKSFAGSNRIIDRTYDIEIKNNKAIAIDLKFVDRIPISQNKEIKVLNVVTNTAEYETKKGLLTWKLNLSPKETKTESFSYQVKYPKYKYISI